MTDLEQLVQYARQKSTWTLDDNKLRGIVVDEAGQRHVQFDEAALSIHSPDLFAALEAYIKRSVRLTREPAVTGDALLPTVLLHTKAWRFASELDRPLWYGEVRSFLLYQTDEGKPWRMWLDGDLLRTDDAWVNGRRVLFVDKVKPQASVVSLTDLNARYPGWEERWLIGTQLGLTHDDLIVQMFPRETHLQAAGPTLSDITFD